MQELITNKNIDELELVDLIITNKPQLMEELKDKLTKYKDVVYSDEQILEAKSDRAALNKYIDTLEDFRKRAKKKYLEPYTRFEREIDELTNLVREPMLLIDQQVKGFEENRKAKKRGEIETFWSEQIGELNDLVELDRIFNDQWLNATYNIKKVYEDITTFINKTKEDIAVIESLNFKQETMLKDYYFRCFNITATLQEKTRLDESERRLEELKQKQTVTQPQPAPQPEPHQVDKIIKTVDFRVYGTTEQLMGLQNYMKENKIKYGVVPKE